MTLCCKQEQRRDAVRRMQGWNGLDYVEVSEDQRTLHAYFLGKLPPELSVNQPGIEKYLRIEGGRRVTGIRIVDIDPVADPDPEKDDFLVLRLDKYGDFSSYTLRLVGVQNIDPRYDHVEFSFKVGCPSDLDCAAAPPCDAPCLAEPDINYLAKDYASFRQLILDRLALLMPDWQERHVPDLGIALVELLAYSGDMLSYYQDAVATEAYLNTARQRISVRRHARLVDYHLHEGCNARAWVCVATDTDHALALADVAFVTGINDGLAVHKEVLTWDDLRDVPTASYEVFEPLLPNRSANFQLYEAHSEMHFYTWGETLCCLHRGSTSATLLDRWVTGDGAQQEQKKADHDGAESNDKPQRALHLAVGDILIFEEVRGPVTGLEADADRLHRHAVRLTKVTPGEDLILLTQEGKPTPYVEIEWAAEDALPFPLCISAMGGAPDCALIDHVSVARGNVILVDHGKTQLPEDLGEVPAVSSDAECECIGHPGDVRTGAGLFRPHLGKAPLTFSAALPSDDPVRQKWLPASSLLKQDVRAALPQLVLTTQTETEWKIRYDLIGSSANDRHAVVEIDNDGVAHLRFGDGESGFQPPAGTRFTATYRTGAGIGGNVGAESISRIVLASPLSGIAFKVRNPLAATGGSAAEPMAEAKLFAPHLFRKTLERAVIANDYRTLAERHAGVQRASAELVWTGSWYEADVAIDPFAVTPANSMLLDDIERELECLRRIGHDLHLEWADHVPLHLELEVCVLLYHQPGHVKAALLDVFSNRVLADGKLGFFHDDNLSFGGGIFLSKIVAAAQAVQGVECATVKVLQRLFESANHEIANGVLPLSAAEIAQLHNDPNFPERGKLVIHVHGGR
ncbi:MAG: putative baseplate assembly protein [Burkholderiales bacterium RIFCSPLOWO2_02_FULL_57_36]|nr:MAG: putative baseplate assembly protein [Burkholderiales bacterium RIFCSPLOWO2_02_FULL_57_36]